MKAFFLLFIVSLGAHGQGLSFRSRLPKVQQLKNPQYSANDIKAEIDFGKGLVARILTKYPLVNQPSLQKYVNSLGAGLAAMCLRGSTSLS
jgi:predicted Zn-dependent protease